MVTISSLDNYAHKIDIPTDYVTTAQLDSALTIPLPDMSQIKSRK